MATETINREFGQLTPIESRELELLLYENFKPGALCDEDVGRDFVEIRNITQEIRSIHKQQVVLVGERIARARTILLNYGEGGATFTEWIDRVFSSRRTAYNILRYYEFHESLPSISLKTNLKKMPLKVAYCLSSRQAPLQKKCEIIENYAGERPEDAILLIKEKLPTSEKDRRRKDSNKIAIEKLHDLVSRLQMRKSHLSDEHVESLRQVHLELETFFK